ncbi:roadblock/LC7 domain-containing protein [Streptomyces sp. NPDC127100]|uniref:roadblock/LC7 domain-containing protein n=1 Tax=Streptomyces sp. NPDC127100 TaxID=3347138 RepID=UPI003654CD05
MTAPKATDHTTAGSGELNWLLDDLVERVASIRKAVVLSGDGLATGASKDLTREDSEHLAAVASGFHLKRGTGKPAEDRSAPADRDAEEVRSRMASLQRGWQRGRQENAAGDAPSDDGTPPQASRPPTPQAPQAPQRTTKGDGR